MVKKKYVTMNTTDKMNSNAFVTESKIDA